MKVDVNKPPANFVAYLTLQFFCVAGSFRIKLYKFMGQAPSAF